jgi:NDP-sugar pyrophosphorylase family protein
MAPVAGRPFLEYLLLQLKKHEIDEVTLCVGYKGSKKIKISRSV